LFGTKKSNKSLNSVYTKSNRAKSTPSKVVPTIINIPQSKDNIKIESDTKSNIHDYDISHLQKPKLTDYDKAMVEQEIEILDDDFSNLPSSNTVESDIDVDIATESVIDALSEDISFEEFVKNPPAESNISASKPHFIVDSNDQIAIVKGETVHDTNIPIVSNIGEDGKLHLKTNPNNQLYSSKSNKKKNTNKKNI
jgi:hypothetical protein